MGGRDFGGAAFGMTDTGDASGDASGGASGDASGGASGDAIGDALLAGTPPMGELVVESLVASCGKVKWKTCILSSTFCSLLFCCCC